MPKLETIDKIMLDKEALLELKWSDLKSLHEKYPYSNLISVALAKKHFLEKGDIENIYAQQSLFIRNNPAYLLNSIKTGSGSSPKEISFDQNRKIIAEKEEVKTSEMNEKDKEITLDDPLIKNNFTKWLISKDKNIKKEYPGEKITDEGEKSSVLKNEIVSESLAEIYTMQGLKKEAIEMYEKLSLKNPKKSTYFAEIIENLKN